METLESVQEPVNRTIRKVPIFLRWPLYYALVLGMLFFGSFATRALFTEGFKEDGR